MMGLFEVADRVRARTSWVVPAGTLGRVQMKLLSVEDMYFVLFDGEDRQRLVHVSELELVADDGALTEEQSPRS